MTTSKEKNPKKQAAKRVEPAESADPPAPQQAPPRRGPYQKAAPTPEREANLPADPELELEALDAMAKELYKRDLEVLEHIESLKRRTAAMLEHINRNHSQFRSCKGAMGRMDSFVTNWTKMEDEWTREQLFGKDTWAFS